MYLKNSKRFIYCLLFLVIAGNTFVSCSQGQKTREFPLVLQNHEGQAGAACLQMIVEWYEGDTSLKLMEKLSRTTEDGTSILDMIDALDTLGFRTLTVNIPYDRLAAEAPLPAITHWQNSHFLIVYNISPDSVWVADPEVGKYVLPAEQFKTGWMQSEFEGKKPDHGVALLVEPTASFYSRRKGFKEEFAKYY